MTGSTTASTASTVERDCVVAVHVGGAKLAAAVVRSDGTILARRQVATPVGTRSSVVNDALCSVVEHVAAVVPAGRILAVGVGSAGPLDLVAGTISPIHISAWRGYGIIAALQDLIPDRPAFLAGDGHCLALGEHRYGDAGASRAMLGIVVGSGVGGGLVIRGQVFVGPTGNAGHVGHMVVDQDGPSCACGGRGCLEAIASGPAMVRWAREHSWAGPDAAALAADARAGHPAAWEAFALAGRALGIAVVNSTALVDLDDVVLGGDVAASGELLLAPLRRSVRELAGLEFVRRVSIRRGRLGADASLLGAAALAFAGSPPAPAMADVVGSPPRR